VLSKNYKGSAKGMQACGAERIVKRLSQEADNRCCMAGLVTNDDGSVCTILTHSFKALLNTGWMTEEDWPRYNNEGVAALSRGGHFLFWNWDDTFWDLIVRGTS
jgi:hypothetical protein